MRELQLQPKEAVEDTRPSPESERGAAPAESEEDPASAPVTWLPPDDE